MEIEFTDLLFEMTELRFKNTKFSISLRMQIWEM